MNKTKKKQTRRYREQTSGYRWGEGRGEGQHRMGGKGLLWDYSKSPTCEPSCCELFKDANVCSINVRREWNCSLPSISYCWWSFSSTISHLLSLLQSVTLLACSLDASPYMPAVVLYYCVLFKVLYCKIKNVYFLCLFIFMYYLCEKYYKPIVVQYCIPACVSWVPRLTLFDLRTNWT